ncbi:putative GAG-pre-integrase domain-containing protein [Helianthus annuus]|nr:putative GAG-pre-integrase domain-containing protein [Helianthus annuus]
MAQQGTVMLAHGTTNREAWLWHRRLGHPSSGVLDMNIQITQNYNPKRKETYSSISTRWIDFCISNLCICSTDGIIGSRFEHGIF